MEMPSAIYRVPNKGGCLLREVFFLHSNQDVINSHRFDQGRSRRMKKFVYLLVVAALLISTVGTAAAAPNAAVTCDQTYTVTAGDWLSKIADQFLGNVKAYY